MDYPLLRIIRGRAVRRCWAVAVALALVACTGSNEAARPRTPPTVSPRPTPPWTPPQDPYPHYGGEEIAWPSTRHAVKSPPQALGAIVTGEGAALTNGRVLEAGLTLPIVGGSATSPIVLTPCVTRVRLVGRGFQTITPATKDRKIVVLDPGHGGVDPGAVGPDGYHEDDRTLQIATLARADLQGHVAHVVMTRTSDREVLLAFRTALADALRASLAVSIHFNTSADRRSPHPGTSVFGAVSDPNGRRAAGVLFETVRSYLDTLSPEMNGRWVSNRDAGAIYRLGRSGGDFYFLLRESRATWVISESMYISNADEARLLARRDVRSGLAQAIATGVMRYLATDAPGSGWREPVFRGFPGARRVNRCTEPFVEGASR